jgi:predicted AAA+ superfamily ATPase
VNFSDISRLAQMPSTTLKRYFSLLQKVFLFVTLPAWTANAEGRLVKSPKIYLNDTGLLCALRQESQSSLRDNRTAAGSILENFVVMEMIKQISWSGPYNRVFHFRSQQEKEVDIVLEGENKKVVGIEVKAASSVTGKEFAGLEALEKLAGNRFNMGIVLYSGKQTFKFGDRMYAVPIDAVWQ